MSADSNCQSQQRFNRYSRYLKNRYGERVYRIGVDAGFGCPHRNGGRFAGGCTYCDELGSRAAYTRANEITAVSSPEDTDVEPMNGAYERVDASGPVLTEGLKQSINNQVSKGREYLRRRYGATAFILYLQAYSGTYGNIDRLRAIYDFCLSLGEFKQFIVSTRPDCFNDEIAELLSGYQTPERDVWIELGLQSTCNATLSRINRGHTVEDFLSAHRIATDYRLKRTIHIMAGLPGEGLEQIVETARFVAGLGPDGLKIHNLYIPEGARLYREYLRGELSVPSMQRHLDYVVRIIEEIPPSVVVMRVTGDPPSKIRVAPRRPIPKSLFYSLLDKELAIRNSFQGKRFSDKNG